MLRAEPRLGRLFWAACVLSFPLASTPFAQRSLDRAGVRPDAPRTNLAPRDVLDFERHPHARVLGESLSLLGDGPILVRGLAASPGSPAPGTLNAALVIDSTAPGEATDLGTPGVPFGGAGIGDGGRVGGPYENRARLGHVLTVADSLADLDGDGLVDRPGDADGASSAVLDLDFSAVGPVVLHSLTVLDVKSTTAAVVLFGENGAPLKALALPLVGDNGTAIVQLGDVRGVARMRVRLDGSGAIDDVVFSRDRAGRIASSVWYDRDGDGVRGPEDAGLSGVRVHLADAFGRLVDVARTRHDGSVEFRRLVAGPYTIGIDESSLPERFFPTRVDVGSDLSDSDASPASVVLATNSSVDASTSFGVTSECSGAIGDYVWFDENQNGLQDEGEPGMQGITLRLYTVIFKGGGQFKVLVDDLVSGPDGFYAFLGLCPGVHFVEVDESTLPPFYSPTICDAGPDRFDSECSPVPVLVRSDIWTTRDVDFGFVSPHTGVIGDFVWIDDDCDGFQDLGDGEALLPQGERGLRGARIILNDDMGVIIAETTSNEDGGYEFVGMADGSYQVGVDGSSVMEGFVPSPCNPGLNDETDNDCSGVEVTLSGGTPALAGGSSSGNVTVIYDFGYRTDPCEGSGCARGPWKQFPDAWPPPYTDDTLFDDVFVRGFPNLTLGQVLELGGDDPVNLVARQAVAALLNAASPIVDYALTIEEVLALWAEAYELRNTPQAVLLPEKGRYLQFLNEQICPFGS